MKEAGSRNQSLLPPALEGLVTGIGCAFLSVAVGLIVRMSAYGPVRQITQSLDPATIETVRAASRPPPEAPDLLTVGILYPVLETLLFLLLYWAMQRDGDLKLRTRSYILLMGALGWLLHGASFQSINRILPFALLAWLFGRWGERAGAWYGFAAAAVAHIVWNSSLLLIYFSRNGFG